MSNKLTGFEKYLVSDWEDCEDLETMVISLYDPVLIPGVFPEDVPTNPDTMTLNGEDSTVSLHWFTAEGEEVETRTFKIELKLLEEIKDNE
jgi:hypothetical protein